MAERRSHRGARPLMAALGALALAGCAADYVGDDWQCPLAQGKVCASVAAADPALPKTLVPETRGTARPIGDLPFYRGIDGRIAAGAPAGRAEPACESECDPFAWLGSLFASIADTGSADTGTAESRRNDGAATVAADTSVGPEKTPVADAPGAAPDVVDASGQPVSGAPEVASPMTASAVPDDAPASAAGETVDAIAADALRTGEVVARIWIAPFVDEDGIYREGSWVRAVIAPAAWRLR